MNITSGNPVVDRFAQINFAGNIHPENWYHWVKLESGKVHLNAITILAEICYWYRPVVERKENDLTYCKLKTKFAKDKYQIFYKQIEQKFGFSRKQSRTALQNLERLGLISIEYRNETIQGQLISNQIYVEPDANKIAYITEHLPDESCSSLYLEETRMLPRGNVIGTSKGCGLSLPSNEEISSMSIQNTKTSTKNSVTKSEENEEQFHFACGNTSSTYGTQKWWRPNGSYHPDLIQTVFDTDPQYFQIKQGVRKGQPNKQHIVNTLKKLDTSFDPNNRLILEEYVESAKALRDKKQKQSFQQASRLPPSNRKLSSQEIETNRRNIELSRQFRAKYFGENNG